MGTLELQYKIDADGERRKKEAIQNNDNAYKLEIILSYRFFKNL